ncbi:hypothetical protein CK203_067141 [Vitis vinifera]|uniref:Reverse transcriptase zinc-binding domain-containing protein n=1 Tax=Vitis vinifera TaxID=29760 RepID=A0A438F5G7_VITVI|nr:hypothetical protein CK203_067141 [Vitis vinifera]
MSLRMVRSLGTGRFIEWGAVNGKGASGGIVVSWNSRVLELVGMEVEIPSGAFWWQPEADCSNEKIFRYHRRASTKRSSLVKGSFYMEGGGGGAKALLLSVLGPSRPFLWNLNFRRNLSDSEIEDLEGLMRSLDDLYLSPSVPDARLWSLSSSGLFSIKSFFLALSQSSGSPQNFPSKFMWNSQVPFKVKSFVWLVAHKKLAKMDWVPPRSIYDMMSIKFKGFGNSKRGIVLWQAASIALIRVVWWERNARIFEDKARNSEFL